MPMSVTATLGVVFLVLSIVSTYLMFRFWGYPYDKERRKSGCPQWKMNVHRAVGYAYAVAYVVMMTQMVPRLWEYQVEFPARTVAHIMLGFTIGVLLVLKISILRWFRHFEEWMPAIGVGLLLCTVLLSGLSLPFVFRERVIASDDVTFSAPNRARVAALLAGTGLPGATDLGELTSERSLRRGRHVLLEECTFCHDLRTAISRPRTPEDWVRTVQRMAEKPNVGPRLDDQDARAVAAYLVAITPELQHSAKARRVAEMDRARTREAAAAVVDSDEDSGAAEDGAAADSAQRAADASRSVTASDTGASAGPADAIPPATATPSARKPRPKRRPPDPAAAKKAYEVECSKCHGLDDVDAAPPRTGAEVRGLIRRMVMDNGMEASRADLELIRFHLEKTFVDGAR